MTTVKTHDVVRDALELLIVQAAEAKIPPDEAAAAIRTLNDLMFQYESQGIYLGYTQINDMGDFLTVPLGAILAIKANLAIQLAPRYNVVPSPALMQSAMDGFKTLVDIGTSMSGSAYPSTLPQGSGNYDNGSGDFYPDEQDTILTETGGSIALEDNTEEG